MGRYMGEEWNQEIFFFVCLFKKIFLDRIN